MTQYTLHERKAGKNIVYEVRNSSNQIISLRRSVRPYVAAIFTPGTPEQPSRITNGVGRLDLLGKALNAYKLHAEQVQDLIKRGYAVGTNLCVALIQETGSDEADEKVEELYKKFVASWTGTDKRQRVQPTIAGKMFVRDLIEDGVIEGGDVAWGLDNLITKRMQEWVNEPGDDPEPGDTEFTKVVRDKPTPDEEIPMVMSKTPTATADEDEYSDENFAFPKWFVTFKQDIGFYQIPIDPAKVDQVPHGWLKHLPVEDDRKAAFAKYCMERVKEWGPDPETALQKKIETWRGERDDLVDQLDRTKKDVEALLELIKAKDDQIRQLTTSLQNEKSISQALKTQLDKNVTSKAAASVYMDGREPMEDIRIISRNLEDTALCYAKFAEMHIRMGLSIMETTLPHGLVHAIMNDMVRLWRAVAEQNIQPFEVGISIHEHMKIGAPDTPVANQGKYEPIRIGSKIVDPNLMNVSDLEAAKVDQKGHELLEHYWKDMQDAGYDGKKILDSKAFLDALYAGGVVRGATGFYSIDKGYEAFVGPRELQPKAEEITQDIYLPHAEDVKRRNELLKDLQILCAQQKMLNLFPGDGRY